MDSKNHRPLFFVVQGLSLALLIKVGLAERNFPHPVWFPQSLNEKTGTWRNAKFLFN